MSRLLLVLTVLVVSLTGTATANAHLAYKPKCDSADCRLKSQERNLAHAEYVCANGEGRHKWWACKATKWLSREVAKTASKMEPPLGIWDRYANCEQGVAYGHHEGWKGFYSSSYEGALGFLHATWDENAPAALGRKLYARYPDATWAPRRFQIRVAEHLRDVRGFGYQPWPGCTARFGIAT